jgi:hypothetical protein
LNRDPSALTEQSALTAVSSFLAVQVYRLNWKGIDCLRGAFKRIPRASSKGLDFSRILCWSVGNPNSINFNLLILKTLKLALGAGLQNGGTNAEPSLPRCNKGAKSIPLE